MREIKFRAWNEKRKDMMDWDALSKYDYLTDAISNPSRILMQYAGLKDKNDVEIYEGDVVRNQQLSGGVLPPGEPYNCVVRFAECAFKPYRINCKYGSKAYMQSEHLEVIGNIYQNPELIK